MEVINVKNKSKPTIIMNNRTLGIIGILCSPFLMINTLHDDFRLDAHSSYGGLFGLIYMSGWICSLIALRRMGAMGKGKFGSIIFTLQIIFLSLTQLWNLYELLQPGAGTRLYYLLEMFWPISNLCMFVTGLTIAIKGRLKGWKRYMPLASGFWLPLGVINWAIFSRTPGMLLFTNIYSAVTWALMGLAVVLLAREPRRNEGTTALPKHLSHKYSLPG